VGGLLGNPVFNLQARYGQPGVGEVWLTPGLYSIRVSGSTTGLLLPSVSYSLTGDIRNDPDGIAPLDTTYSPNSSNSTNSAPPRGPTYYSTSTTTPNNNSTSNNTSTSSGGTTSSGSTTPSSTSTSTSSPPPDDPYSQPYWM
jgi:hypothetical protein